MTSIGNNAQVEAGGATPPAQTSAPPAGRAPDPFGNLLKP